MPGNHFASHDAQSDGDRIPGLSVLLRGCTAEVPIWRKLLNEGVLPNGERSDLGRMAQGCPRVIWHGDESRAGQVEAQPLPPTRPSPLGIPRATHRFLLEFNGHASPIGARGNPGEILFLARAEVHYYWVLFLEATNRIAQRSPRYKAVTRLAEQRSSPGLGGSAVSGLRKVHHCVITVPNEESTFP